MRKMSIRNILTTPVSILFTMNNIPLLNEKNVKKYGKEELPAPVAIAELVVGITNKFDSISGGLAAPKSIRFNNGYISRDTGVYVDVTYDTIKTLKYHPENVYVFEDVITEDLFVAAFLKVNKDVYVIGG